jgi:hypothetical protein
LRNGDLPEQLLGDLLGHPRLPQAPVDESLVELLHLPGGAPRAHRPPEPVRVGRAEPRDLDGDPHDLLLVQDDPEGVAQDRRE